MKILNTIYYALVTREEYPPLRNLWFALRALIIVFGLFFYDIVTELAHDPININDIIFNLSCGAVFYLGYLVREAIIKRNELLQHNK